MTLAVYATAIFLSAALLCAGCGDTSSGPSPSKVFITQIQTSAGLASRTFASGPLNSDVLTAGSIVDDLAQVSFQLTLKDPGVPGNTNQPSVLNAVTFTRYHVDFRRADGRNTPGVDVQARSKASKCRGAARVQPRDHGRMLDEELECLIIERREPVAQQRCLAVAEDGQQNGSIREGPPKNRLAPQRRGEWNRHDLGWR